MFLYNPSCYLETEYPELKKRLEEAVKKKDKYNLEQVLDEIDRKIPIDALPKQDIPLQENAKTLLAKLEIREGVQNAEPIMEIEKFLIYQSVNKCEHKTFHYTMLFEPRFVLVDNFLAQNILPQFKILNNFNFSIKF